MALAPDQWELVASGDSTAVPNVQLPPGRDYKIEVDLPFAVPDALAWSLGAGISSAVGVFATVRSVDVSGARVTIVMAG